MSKGGMEIDVNDMLKKLGTLTGKEAAKVRRSALVSSMGVLKRATDSLYKRRTKLASRTTKLPRKGKPGKSVVSFDKKNNRAKVHILNDFMMKWFELGTDERRTKKGKRAGKIKPMRLFTQAQGQVEQKIIDELDIRIAKSIQRVWNKKSKI